jgi:TPR repeat protein
MYENGQGVPQDAVQAHMWFNLAASRQTDPERRSMMAKNRDSLAARMTREQIAEAQRRARDWKPKPE